MQKGNFFNFVTSFIFTLLLLGLGKEVSAVAYSEATLAEISVTSQNKSDHQRLLVEPESFKQIEESDSDDDVRTTSASVGNSYNTDFSFVALAQFSGLFVSESDYAGFQALPLFIRYRNLRI